jgi:hypothetical protein
MASLSADAVGAENVVRAAHGYGQLPAKDLVHFRVPAASQRSALQSLVMSAATHLHPAALCRAKTMRTGCE